MNDLDDASDATVTPPLSFAGVDTVAAPTTFASVHGRHELDPLATLAATDDLLDVTFANAAAALRSVDPSGASNPSPAPDLDVSLVGELADRTRHQGKRLRPLLAHWGWVVAGAPSSERQELVHLTAALELLHLFALLQDDVMDRSDSRRGRETIHVATARRHRRAGRGSATRPHARGGPAPRRDHGRAGRAAQERSLHHHQAAPARRSGRRRTAGADRLTHAVGRPRRGRVRGA